MPGGLEPNYAITHRKDRRARNSRWQISNQIHSCNESDSCDKWYGIIPDPTVADAVMDRLIHNAYIITMKGESMRKKQSKNGGKNNENN